MIDKALYSDGVHISGAVLDNMTADGLAHLIRPVIGLTKPQAVANYNYYSLVKTNLLKENPNMRIATAESRAREAAARYAGQQHRYRAMMIARTELASAYNHGMYSDIRYAQEQGLLGDVVKVWVTAGDDRVCPICKALDGEKASMNDMFSNGEFIPPAHPHCRCGIEYREIT
jgi:SPP1 gp7 family putative phage head morphogenesis protein